MKREKHHDLQCFNIPEIFSDSHGIHIVSCYKKYVWNYFSWLVFRHFKRYAQILEVMICSKLCSKICSKFLVFLIQRSSCSQVIAFQLNGCLLCYKKVRTRWQRVCFFFNYFSSKSYSWIVYVNCTGKGFANLL